MDALIVEQLSHANEDPSKSFENMLDTWLKLSDISFCSGELDTSTVREQQDH